MGMRSWALVGMAAGLMSVAGIAQATEKTWNGTAQSWTWEAEPQCKLRVDKVTQPNESQPLHVTVTNVSPVRLQYTLGIRVLRNGKEVFKDTISVDNANSKEQSMRPTSRPLMGVLQGALVYISLRSCSIRS